MEDSTLRKAILAQVRILSGCYLATFATLKLQRPKFATMGAPPALPPPSDE